jgi:hypothetical protein
MLIPRYEDSQVKNVAVSIPQAQALGPDAFGAGIAKGLAQVADAGQSIVVQETHKANLKTAQDATIFLNQLGSQADLEIKSTVGDAAFGTPDNPEGVTVPTLKKFDDKFSEWANKNVTNDTQRDYVNKLHAEKRTTLEHSGLTHQYQEKTKSEDKSYQSVKSSLLDQVAVYAVDPAGQDKYEKAVIDGIAHIDAFATTRGWTQEQIDAEVANWEGSTAKVKAVQMMTLNPSGAKAFIEENKDVLGSDYTQLKHNVDLVEADTIGVNAAEAISSRLQKDGYTALRGELYKQFGGGTQAFNSKAFKVAEAQLASNNQALKIEQKQNSDKLEVPVLQFMASVNGTGRAVQPKELMALPAYKDMITSTDAAVVEKATQIMANVRNQSHQEAVFERSMANSGRAEARAAQAQQQRDDWYSLLNNPDKIAEMSEADMLRTASTLGTYGDDLVKAHKKLVSPEALGQAKIDASILKGVYSTLKIPTKKQGAIQDALTNYVIAEQGREKKIITPGRMRELIGAAIQDVTVNERVSPLGMDSLSYDSTTKKKLYEVKNQDAIVIPSKESAGISALLKGYGIEDSPKNRIKFYKATLAEKAKGGK